MTDHGQRHRLLQPVEEAAIQPRDQADTRLKVSHQIRFAMLLEAGGRPATTRHAEGGVAAGRHAVDADLVELQQRREARIAADRIDGARHLGRPQLPAVGARVAVVPVVVSAVFRQGDNEAGFDQAARQIGMHPGRAARAVRDDDQPAVATQRCALCRHVQRERAALERPRFGAGRVVQRDRAVGGGGRDLAQAHRSLRAHRAHTGPCGKHDRRHVPPAAAPSRNTHRVNQSTHRERSPSKATAPGEANDDDVCQRCLAEACTRQPSASRFQEPASFSRRNSVGVRPVAALNARLNGPIDWKPAPSAIVNTGSSRRNGSASAVRASSSR